MFTNYEIAVAIGAVIVMIIGLAKDYKNSKKPNQPTHPRPEPWDKSYED